MAVSAIALLSAAFLLTHLALSHPPVRGPLVARLGRGPFLLAYSAVALATYLPLAALWWFDRHAGAALWVWRSPVAVHLTEIVAATGVAFTVGALVQPAPSSHTARQRDRLEVRGLAHVTRHPLFLGLGLLCGAHLIANGWLGDVLFLGTNVALAALGAVHQDARLTAERPAYADFVARTTAWPNPAGLPRIGARAATGLLAGLVLAVALRYAHRWF